jgi:signal transduction histidine kinase/CheY-like chemotaxis protein
MPTNPALSVEFVARLHKLLQVQVGNLLPTQLLEEEATLEAFLEKVSRTYIGYERDRSIAEHAYNISEQEYQTLTQQLRQQAVQSQEYVRQVRAALATLQDDSDGTADANSLSNLLERLQERISLTKKLEQELIEAKIMAEEAARVKSEFLSVMSHEIRTPLNAIIGLAYLMRHETNPEEQAQNLTMLTQSCENLLGLVTDVLDFSKLEEKRLQLQHKPFNLRQMLDRLVSAQLVTAQKKGLSVRLMLDSNMPEHVFGDTFRLQQILNNLISNAIKFTTKGGVTVEVVAGTNPEGGPTNEVQFAVQDTGIGISRKAQGHLFERFSQASANTSKVYGGSGLGLAIVRELVELHGGQILLVSELGKGTRFSFTLSLPAAAPKEKAASASLASQPLPRLEGIHLLLAEDLPLNVLVAQRLLERQGAVVAVAEDGHKAVNMVKEGAFHLILMDLQMPNLDGIEATHALREAGVATPIIALSADASPSARARALDAGMASFVAKPFNPEHLIKEILQYVGTGKVE